MKLRNIIVGLLLFEVGLMIGACAPTFHPVEIPEVGGVGWRVTNAEKFSNADRDLLLAGIHKEVEECLGQTNPIDNLDLYSVSSILYAPSGDGFEGWAMAQGLYFSPESTANKRPRIYILKTMGMFFSPRTLRHELVHHVTGGEGHPEVNDKLRQCAP